MARLVIVGEAWGAREKLFEHPFVGYSGYELAKMLAEAKLAPDMPRYKPSEYEMIDFWRNMRENHGIIVTNVFNEQPLDNNIELFFTSPKDGGCTDIPPLKRGKFIRPELMYHLENLWQEITAASPNLILALGNTACWATLREAKISDLRGAVKMSPTLNVKVLPTFHPAAVLRQWNLRPIVVTDLEKAAREVNYKEVIRIKRWLTINPTLSDLEEWFTRPAEFYAVDIENPKKEIAPGKYIYLRGQIAMIGFSREHDDAIVVPFFEPDAPGGSYWPTVEDEMRAWRIADAALKAPIPKIFQNGIYDLSHLIRVGFRPRLCRGDTMLLHHALYPEMLKGLGFLGSIYSDEIAWKTMAKKGNNLKRDE